MPDNKPERPTVPIDYLESQYARLRYVKQQRAMLDEIEQLAQDAIKDALGENEVGTIRGIPAAAWVKSWPKRFNSAKFRADHPDVWEQYKEPPKQPVRTFTLIDEEN